MKTFTMEKTIPLSLTLMETLPSKKIVSGRYDLSFTMITEAESTNADTLLNAQYNQNVSFSKVFLFIEQFVNHSVIFESDKNMSTEIYDFLNEWENNLIVLPDLHESTIIAALHSKFNNIVSENTYVDKVSLVDLAQNITYHYVLTEEDDEYTELPPLQDWMGEFSYFDDAWWNQCNTRTVDRPAKDAEEVEKWKKKAEEADYDSMVVQPFNDIEDEIQQIFKEMSGQLDDEKTSKGELIELNEFKKKKDQKEWKPRLV